MPARQFLSGWVWVIQDLQAGASVYILTHLATMNTIIPTRTRWNGYQVDTCVWWQHETFSYMPCWLAVCLCFWPSRAAHLMVRVLHETWVRSSVKCRALVQKTPTGERRCPSGAAWKLRCRCGEADVTSEGTNLDNHTFFLAHNILKCLVRWVSQGWATAKRHHVD